MYKTSPKADMVKKFMHWIISDGQNDCKALYYAPLPESVRKLAAAAIDAQ